MGAKRAKSQAFRKWTVKNQMGKATKIKRCEKAEAILQR